MVVIIGLITFVLGCVITYYFDHSGVKEPEKSNLELKEDAIRARAELQHQQQNLARLLELAIRNAVDETVKSMITTAPEPRRAPNAAPDRRSLYNQSYNEVKRSWSRLSETKAETGENGSAAPRKMEEVMPLPEKLDFEFSAPKPQPPPTADAATTASTPVIDLDEASAVSEPEEIPDLEEIEPLSSDEPASSDTNQKETER
jgi:hypothetical protein